MDKAEYKAASRAWNKAIVKSPEYTALVNNKLERAERLSSKTGNVYTASIFLALLSDLYYSEKDGLNKEQILFFAYGSGSKSKVFQGKMNPKWTQKVQTWNIVDQLAARRRVDFDTYVKLRLHKLEESVSPVSPEVYLDNSGILDTNRFSRNYILE